MRRLIKSVFVLVLAVGVTYGAAKGYLYYRVKQALDDLAYRAENLGNEFAYGAIETDLRGQVAVNDLSFTTNGLTQPLTVEQIRISGPDALYFLDPRNSWSTPTTGGKPPPRLRVSMVGMQTPPLHELPGQTIATDPMIPLDGCGAGAADQAAMLAALGIDRMVLDGEFGWDFDDVDDRLKVELRADYPEIQSIAMRIDLADVTPEMLQNRASMPQLARLETSIAVDPAFGNKFAMICGERLGIAPDEFKSRFVTERLQDMETTGLKLGAGLRFAMQTFVDNWGEIKLIATPSEPVGLLSMVFMPPDRLLETLNANLRVNNTDISDLSFNWSPPEGGMTSFGALVGSEQPTQQTPPRRRIRYENYWVNVNASGLGGYLRREVRLYTADQPPREGILLAVRDGTAEVQQRIHGGKFTAYVSVDEITRAEVQSRREIQSAQSTPQ